jgi:hypothetical protein
MGITETTHAVREQAFLTVACDIPQELTLEQYRSRRRRPEPRQRRRRLRLPQLSTK